MIDTLLGAGVTQRMTRSAARSQASSTAHGLYPCFQPLPESQPVLPCLLRRLLQKGKAKEALSLATAHSQAPHFPRSLEWLLFTSLEINNNQISRTERCVVMGLHKGMWRIVMQTGVLACGSEPGVYNLTACTYCCVSICVASWAAVDIRNKRLLSS